MYKFKQKKFGNVFRFGYEHKDYAVKVLNDREVRAASGIVFLLLMTGLFIAYFTWNILLLKYIITITLVDFLIRVLVSPHFSPFLILGRLIVSSQIPEYTGAPQKRFAWTLGLLFVLILFIIVVLQSTWGILPLVVGIIFLSVLFIETAFGICMGCKMYRMITKKQAQLCPGGACEVRQRDEIQKVTRSQWLVLIFAVLLIILFGILF